MAKQVIKWEAADGTQHDSKEEAVRHDQLAALVAKLGEFETGDAYLIDDAANWVLDNYMPRPSIPAGAVYRVADGDQLYKVDDEAVWMMMGGAWLACILARSAVDVLVASGAWVGATDPAESDEPAEVVE